jgi:hypothetical protein
VTGNVGGSFGSGQSVEQIDRLFFVLLAEMGVPGGHGQAVMLEDLLDLLQVGAPHDHVAGEGVPQVVEPEVLDTCPSAGRVEGRLDAGYGLW